MFSVPKKLQSGSVLILIATSNIISLSDFSASYISPKVNFVAYSGLFPFLYSLTWMLQRFCRLSWWSLQNSHFYLFYEYLFCPRNGELLRMLIVRLLLIQVSSTSENSPQHSLMLSKIFFLMSRTVSVVLNLYTLGMARAITLIPPPLILEKLTSVDFSFSECALSSSYRNMS